MQSSQNFGWKRFALAVCLPAVALLAFFWSVAPDPSGAAGRDEGLTGGMAVRAQDGQEVYYLPLRQNVNGYTGASDTYINEWSADSNFNDASHWSELQIRPGGPYKRSLLQFNLEGQIPEGARIVTATLRLWTTGYRSADRTMTLNLYRLLHPWDANQATYRNRLTGITWDGLGATADTDRSGPVASVLIAALNTEYALDVTGVISDWVGAGVSNYGFLLEGTSGAAIEYRFWASDWMNEPNKRPLLEIYYSFAPRGDTGADEDSDTHAHADPDTRAGQDYYLHYIPAMHEGGPRLRR